MKSPETTREAPTMDVDKALDFVRHLLDDYSEEFPKEIVVDPEKAVTHKCQKNWFQGVIDALGIVRQHLEFNGQTTPSEINSFVTYYTSKKFHNQEKTTKGDVEQANEVLRLGRKLLSELKKK